MNPLDDTIIAISTPPGYGGLGIVRLSGRRALEIARKIFRPRGEKKTGFEARRLVFGDLYDIEKNEALDEGFLALFPAPHSYTTENMAEISCHGSPVILEEAVRLGTKAGARHAHPGEFTLRAYLLGRIDILQAEAVNDLIRAVSLAQARLSLRQIRGGLSQRIEDIRERILQTASVIEAAIEFPDESWDISRRQIDQSLQETISAVNSLVSTYEIGRAMAEGLTLAIVGRANVGKSTLFNAVLEENRAIVSRFPGTTRDYLRERIKLGDAVFHLVDMAGLEGASHPVEKEGVRRGEKIAARADGVLLVLDASRPESRADLRLLKKFGDKKAILILNKCDLPRKMDEDVVRRTVPAGVPYVEISALKGTHLDRLRGLIRKTFAPSQQPSDDVILHQRQKLLLEQVVKGLAGALQLLRQGHSEEICAEEIRGTVRIVGQLTGEIRAEDIIESIFSRFCVGK